ncbi:lysine transporter LysE [Halioglobus japonicus]|uniref:LysE family translocator n=1 Tax=Halioglobus japonicus TaxID=930805 RepID=A0AAP8MC92_9GAMM|nr:LysE family translocator [Halioglobus japonicus]AQA17186.1 lysine transporter LysE [Halioglobus japonicus]PLW85100.1 LysE family translocator [Halioglobus japonicus]GHD19457.1 amino acid transporter LysE [Halioglobus japonicus]
MSYELFAGLAMFSFVSSITPGPNNLMLMASGANFGLTRTLPHMAGVALGFTGMVVLVGLGLLGLFDAYPVSYAVLKVCSIAYLLYLAWKIATASSNPAGEESEESTGTPMTFVQAVLFQWVNPKAWTMALTALSVYAPDQSLLAVLLVAAVFGAINLPCISVWTLAGLQLQRVLTSRRRLVAFNVSMALLLVVSLYPVFL